MAITDLPNRLESPGVPGISITPTMATTFAITAANASDKLAMIGRVSHAAKTGNKNISKVHFLFGAVTKSNGSTLRLSLQDVDLSNGPVIRPDGTADQSVTIANADAGFTANGWYTATLGATRTVAYGDLLAVVWDWNGAGVTGDSVAIAGLAVSSAASNGGSVTQQNCCVQFTSSAWGVISMMTNVLLEFDDGTFGTLDGSFVLSATNSTSFKSDSTPDEYALEFVAPFTGEADFMWCLVNPGAANDFDMVLYEGTTAKATVTFDLNAAQAASGRVYKCTFPKVAITQGLTYRVAVKATSATTNLAIYYTDLNNAAHRVVRAFGTAALLNTRTDAGAWGAGTTTRRPFIGIGFSGIDIDPPNITNTSGAHASVG